MKLLTHNLETKRLILKKGSIEDYRLVYEFDFTKLRNINGEFEFVKQDLDKIVGFDTYADLNPYVLDWIIYLKEGTPIGNIVANRFNNELNSLELSFNLHPNYWGLGYMNEALIEVMNYIFSLGFENILCGYSEGNEKSKG
ncbi:MAG: GNAT family N-acetyltransferase [Bacilli bacterium]|nr:GNAT family N-acetyltransferase [Bacilli bacterium]